MNVHYVNLDPNTDALGNYPITTNSDYQSLISQDEIKMQNVNESARHDCYIVCSLSDNNKEEG